MKIYVLTISGGVRSAHSTYKKAKDAVQAFASSLNQPSSVEWSEAGLEAVCLSKKYKYRAQVTELTLDEV